MEKESFLERDISSFFKKKQESTKKEDIKIEKKSFWEKIEAVATSSIKFGIYMFLINLAFICFFNLFEIMEGEFPWGEWIYFSFNIGIYSFMAWFILMLFVVLLAKKANKK